jgi:hypothetical protein
MNEAVIRLFLVGTALEFAVFAAISMFTGDLILALVLAGVSALAIVFHRNL